MGERGNLWNIFVLTANCSVTFWWIANVVCQSPKKLFTQLVIHFGIFLLRKLWINFWCETVSKALATFMLNKVATLSSSCLQTVCTCFVNNFKAVSVDLSLQAPIWVSGSSWYVSARYKIFFPMIDSITFPSMLSKATGQ